jgi:hypothetical protein
VASLFHGGAVILLVHVHGLLVDLLSHCWLVTLLDHWLVALLLGNHLSLAGVEVGLFFVHVLHLALPLFLLGRFLDLLDSAMDSRLVGRLFSLD